MLDLILAVAIGTTLSRVCEKATAKAVEAIKANQQAKQQQKAESK